jgi:hypothetical protein
MENVFLCVTRQEIGGGKRVTHATNEEKNMGHRIGAVEHDCWSALIRAMTLTGAGKIA